jgi:hypothetical protein
MKNSKKNVIQIYLKNQNLIKIDRFSECVKNRKIIKNILFVVDFALIDKI